MSESGGISLIASWFILGVVVVALLIQGGALTPQQHKATAVHSHGDGSIAAARPVDGPGKK